MECGHVWTSWICNNWTACLTAVQGVIDHVSNRLKSSDVFSAFSLFDPRHLPSTEASLSEYGTEKLRTMTNFYGSKQQVTFEGETGTSDPDVDPELTEAEWKIFAEFSIYGLTLSGRLSRIRDTRMRVVWTIVTDS